MTDIDKVKNNALLVHAIKEARAVLPGLELFVSPSDLSDTSSTALFIKDASYDDCDRIGCAVLPGYSYEEAGNFKLPIFIGPVKENLHGLLDVTHVEV